MIEIKWNWDNKICIIVVVIGILFIGLMLLLMKKEVIFFRLVVFIWKKNV